MCLGRACESAIVFRDGGDCNSLFFNAGKDAALPCDRDTCSVTDQDYLSPQAGQCSASCFRASCDWSKSMCARVHVDIARCPLFDAAALGSLANDKPKDIHFVLGGSARY